ncbi:uncharacterized protein [Temnothorax nylanderi]|uniref:uncharacterized protein n=1 Tax=Temnothorax nylanderi TaxID=102681 RepID=UPI003A89D9EB
MNKKNHRLVGTLSSKDGMQNLIADLENAKSTSSPRIVSSVTLSQPLIHSTPYTKKPLTETNKGIKYTNANTKKPLTETNKGIKYTNANTKKPLTETNKGIKYTNDITKKPLTEMNKRIKYTDDTHVISNSDTSLLTTKKQLPQNSVTLTPQCEQSEQAITNRSTFQLKEYKSKNQCFNQMSVPKNTASQIKPSETSNKSIIAKSSDCSLNTSKSNVTEHKHIINVFRELFQKVNERLDIIEKTESENHAMLLRLTKITNRRVQSMPKCFPFKSVENLMQFDDASDEIYNEVVSILVNNFYFIYAKNINYFL